MALSQKRLTTFYGDQLPVYHQIAVDGGSKIYEGAIACLNSLGYLTKGATGTGLIAVGIAQQLADNTSGADGAISCKVRSGVAKLANSSGDAVTIAEVGKVCWIEDDQTVAKTDAANTLSPAGLVVAVETDGVRVLISPFVSRELLDAEDGTLVAGALLAADAANTTGVTGGNLIGYDDSGSKTSAATVADALDEIYVDALSAQASVGIPLTSFREVSSAGDVGDITANGGILASDTTPILRGNANEVFEISWAATNVDPIQCQFTLPPDFNGAAAVTFEAWVNSGTTNGASFTVESSWDGGALVSDSIDDSGTKSATTHRVTATIAAADIPDGARFCNIALTPPAHATDAIQLLAAGILYTRKLLTS